MDEYGNDDGWVSNYDENSDIQPDDNYGYSVQNTQAYEEPNTFGYGQTSNIDQSQYDPFEGDSWQDQLGLTQNSSPVPNSQPEWLNSLLSGGGNQLPGANTGPAQSGGTSSFLSQLFGGGSKLLGALMEGKQNKKYANNLGAISNKIQGASDPFGSQRPFYQQQAQQAVTDPYASPLVRMQTDELLRQANIGGAAHGRSRIQNLSPALLAEQAKIAMGYQEQMARQGGYQMKPDTGAMLAASMGGAKADASGYGSPLASAFGNIVQTNQNQTNLDSILNALKAQRGN